MTKFARYLTEEEMESLRAQRERMSRAANEEVLSHYKWTVAGVVASLPLPAIFGLKGAKRFYPLLLLGSLGSMVDLGEGYKETLPLRRDAGAVEALLLSPNSMPLRRDAVRKGWLSSSVLEEVPESHPDAVPVVLVATGAPEPSTPPRAP